MVRLHLRTPFIGDHRAVSMLQDRTDSSQGTLQGDIIIWICFVSLIRKSVGPTLQTSVETRKRVGTICFSPYYLKRKVFLCAIVRLFNIMHNEGKAYTNYLQSQIFTVRTWGRQHSQESHLTSHPVSVGPGQTCTQHLQGPRQKSIRRPPCRVCQYFKLINEITNLKVK